MGAGPMRTGPMAGCAETAGTRANGVVLPFVLRRPRIHEPELGEDPSLGGFLLIYEDDDVWASWGVAVRPGSFELWRPSSGATIGWFDTLREALQAVKRVA
jgi:hypothetical protein